jgi:hypothetical protein
MGSLSSAIRQMIDSMTLGATKGQMNRRVGSGNLLEIEESPRVDVESRSMLNIRLQRVSNGWVVNKTIESSGSYESETHVCGANDNVIDIITELVALHKLNA